MDQRMNVMGQTMNMMVQSVKVLGMDAVMASRIAVARGGAMWPGNGHVGCLNDWYGLRPNNNACGFQVPCRNTGCRMARVLNVVHYRFLYGEDQDSIYCAWLSCDALSHGIRDIAQIASGERPNLDGSCPSGSRLTERRRTRACVRGKAAVSAGEDGVVLVCAFFRGLGIAGRRAMAAVQRGSILGQSAAAYPFVYLRVHVDSSLVDSVLLQFMDNSSRAAYGIATIAHCKSQV